jgi:hypothetical protein
MYLSKISMAYLLEYDFEYHLNYIIFIDILF